LQALVPTVCAILGRHPAFTEPRWHGCRAAVEERLRRTPENIAAGFNQLARQLCPSISEKMFRRAAEMVTNAAEYKATRVLFDLSRSNPARKR